MTDLTTAPITIEEIRLWQESTPADYTEWDLETIGDCDRFLMILIERMEAPKKRAAQHEFRKGRKRKPAVKRAFSCQSRESPVWRIQPPRRTGQLSQMAIKLTSVKESHL